MRTELISDTQSELARFPDVAVTHRVYHANPAKSLIIASQDARMLVVGSRGLGGFRELVLGSVSDQCVRYALCPVLVTRGPSRVTRAVGRYSHSVAAASEAFWPR